MWWYWNPKTKISQTKRHYFNKNKDINKIVVSLLLKKDTNILLATKMKKKTRPLCIFLPKMSAFRKEFDQTNYMSFLIKDDELLEKYN